MDWEKIDKAITLIKDGFTKRVDLENVIVYACGSVIRIDIKGEM